eukprot:TRINITY_DN26233_c0_g1_i1.p1 TRINITY_DN26233_c0_g1~~TRINITY_DN26233_c0_g1_i1.p1  ORF type:complete len:454 (+),score=236.87 TRINITY_DN26233_c0_g1_i1:34-1395(+)
MMKLDHLLVIISVAAVAAAAAVAAPAAASSAPQAVSSLGGGGAALNPTSGADKSDGFVPLANNRLNRKMLLRDLTDVPDPQASRPAPSQVLQQVQQLKTRPEVAKCGFEEAHFDFKDDWHVSALVRSMNLAQKKAKELPGKFKYTATGPQQVCCFMGNATQQERCRKFLSHTANDFDNCVGGMGVDCEGVIKDFSLGALLGKVQIYLIRPRPFVQGAPTMPDATPQNGVNLLTTVGSIVHDLCCIDKPNGAFCTGTNYPVRSLIRVKKPYHNGCDCLAEMRKAVHNLIKGRGAYMNWNKQDRASVRGNLGVRDTNNKWSRSTRLPLQLYNGLQFALPLLREVEYTDDKVWAAESHQTRVVAFPENARLDCPECRDLPTACDVKLYLKPKRGRAKTRKPKDKVDELNRRIFHFKSCSKRHTDAWKAEFATKGDAKFCASGRFKWVDNNGFGVCA